MQIPILIERVKGNGYKARGAEPFALSARGATRAEALAKLQAKIQARMQQGAEIVSMEVGPSAHPWMEFAGMFKDDPLIEEWKEAMAEYRRKVDEDLDAL